MFLAAPIFCRPKCISEPPPPVGLLVVGALTLNFGSSAASLAQISLDVHFFYSAVGRERRAPLDPCLMTCIVSLASCGANAFSTSNTSWLRWSQVQPAIPLNWPMKWGGPASKSTVKSPKNPVTLLPSQATRFPVGKGERKLN